MEGLHPFPLSLSPPSTVFVDLKPRQVQPVNANNLVLEGKEIGAGNFGTIFKAKYNFLPCVVKVLHPKFQNGAFREAVYRERAILSSLRHPNIVQFLDIQDYSPPSPAGGSHRSLVALIMEMMDENLTSLLSRHKRAGALLWHTLVDICHDVTLALHYLHTRGVVYCILSSNNVLLLKGRAKISDLGVSKVQNLGAESSPYIAPEIRMNQVSLQSDVFSFGILLIQMITLKPPEPKFMLTHDLASGSLAMATELDRRRGDIACMRKRHKLRSTALSCISDSELSRPTTADLCAEFEGRKNERDYRKSMRKKELVYESSSSDDSSDERDDSSGSNDDSSTNSEEESETDTD